MNLIQRWWARIDQQRVKDTKLETKPQIRSGEKNWVTPADIEALEEAKVPWLREKRQAARRQAQNNP